MEDFFLSLEGSLRVNNSKNIIRELWVKPLPGFYKFSVDEAARGKPSPVGIGGMAHDDRGVVAESIGVKKSE